MAAVKVPKAPVEHRDKLGRILRVGDCVAYPDNNTLVLGTIKSVSKKMVIVVVLGRKPRTPRTWVTRDTRKYSDDCILLEGSEVTMYILKLSMQ